MQAHAVRSCPIWRVLAAAGLAAAASPSLAQSTAFTYQGRLMQAGQAAGGTYDMRFRVNSAPTGGSQPGPTFCADNVSVAGGLFTVVIDVGQQFATGEARYLEIEVRPDTGQNCGTTTGYTVLVPRQPLTDTPRAMVANIAHALAIPNGSSLNAVALDNSGNVGMGTATPTSHLDIFGTQDALKLRGPQPFMTFVDTAASNTRVLLQNGAGRFYVVSESFLNGTNTGGFTIVDPQGRFGVGTYNPAGPLDVRSGDASYVLVDPSSGDLRFIGGSDGQFGFYNEGPSTGGTYFISQTTGIIGPGVLNNGTIRIAPTIRWKSVHGSAFQPESLDSPGSGTIGGMVITDSFGTTTSGTIGYAAALGVPSSFFAPLELPDGATLLDVCLDAKDNITQSDLVLSLGKIYLATGYVTEMATTFTTGASTALQHACNGGPIPNPVVDNANYVYFLRARMTSGPIGNHWLLAARVKYSITAPLPRFNAKRRPRSARHHDDHGRRGLDGLDRRGGGLSHQFARLEALDALATGPEFFAWEVGREKVRGRRERNQNRCARVDPGLVGEDGPAEPCDDLLFGLGVGLGVDLAGEEHQHALGVRTQDAILTQTGGRVVVQRRLGQAGHPGARGGAALGLGDAEEAVVEHGVVDRLGVQRRHQRTFALEAHAAGEQEVGQSAAGQRLERPGPQWCAAVVAESQEEDFLVDGEGAWHGGGGLRCGGAGPAGPALPASYSGGASGRPVGWAAFHPRRAGRIALRTPAGALSA